MSFLLELVLAVSVRAAASKLALSIDLEVPAQLGLLLHFVRVLELNPLFCSFKVSFLSYPGSLAKRLI
jgi:hypothetical protein